MRRLGLAAIWLYQRLFSRWTPNCPEPETCSEFGKRMIREHGLELGLRLTIERIENCGRYSGLPDSGLYDHVGGNPSGHSHSDLSGGSGR